MSELWQRAPLSGLPKKWLKEEVVKQKEICVKIPEMKLVRARSLWYCLRGRRDWTPSGDNMESLYKLLKNTVPPVLDLWESARNGGRREPKATRKKAAMVTSTRSSVYYQVTKERNPDCLHPLQFSPASLLAPPLTKSSWNKPRTGRALRGSHRTLLTSAKLPIVCWNNSHF